MHHLTTPSLIEKLLVITVAFAIFALVVIII
jgi:hypothetical protein